MGKINAEKYMQYATICVKKKQKESCLPVLAVYRHLWKTPRKLAAQFACLEGAWRLTTAFAVREGPVPFRPHPPKTEPDLRPLAAEAGSAWEGAGLRAQPFSHLVVWGPHTNH